jgi:hypothetical protein
MKRLYKRWFHNKTKAEKFTIHIENQQHQFSEKNETNLNFYTNLGKSRLLNESKSISGDSQIR